MGKNLSELTQEELWELFPIFLTEHQDRWTEDYHEMEECLRSGLSEIQLVRISHIGSTHCSTRKHLRYRCFRVLFPLAGFVISGRAYASYDSLCAGIFPGSARGAAFGRCRIYRPTQKSQPKSGETTCALHGSVLYFYHISL